MSEEIEFFLRQAESVEDPLTYIAQIEVNENIKALLRRLLVSRFIKTPVSLLGSTVLDFAESGLYTEIEPIGGAQLPLSAVDIFETSVGRVVLINPLYSTFKTAFLRAALRNRRVELTSCLKDERRVKVVFKVSQLPGFLQDYFARVIGDKSGVYTALENYYMALAMAYYAIPPTPLIAPSVDYREIAHSTGEVEAVLFWSGDLESLYASLPWLLKRYLAELGIANVDHLYIALSATRILLDLALYECSRRHGIDSCLPYPRAR